MMITVRPMNLTEDTKICSEKIYNVVENVMTNFIAYKLVNNRVAGDKKFDHRRS